jgi:hypothetical protein
LVEPGTDGGGEVADAVDPIRRQQTSAEGAEVEPAVRRPFKLPE